MRQPRTLGKKALKRKSALLAELLVQLVFIRKTRTSCGCHDGFFFLNCCCFGFFFPPPRTVAGVRNARCVAADGRTSGYSLRPPQNLRTVQLLAGVQRTNTNTNTLTLTHTLADALTSARGSVDGDFPLRERGGEDGRFKYRTRAGDVSSPHDALPLIKKGKKKRGEKVDSRSERALIEEFSISL